MKIITISFFVLMGMAVYTNSFACDGKGDQAKTTSTGSPTMSGTLATTK